MPEPTLPTFVTSLLTEPGRYSLHLTSGEVVLIRRLVGFARDCTGAVWLDVERLQGGRIAVRADAVALAGESEQPEEKTEQGTRGAREEGAPRTSMKEGKVE